MFYLNKDKELDAALLQKMINRFYMHVQPKLAHYKGYYDGIQKILQKQYQDPSKPCTRTVVNYCKNIVDSYCGYLATPGYISYMGEQIDDIMEILKYNDYQAEDSDFLLNALIYGTSAELMYMDNEGKTRFKLIDPRSCFGVCDDSLTGDLMYFVRIYDANEWDDSDTYNVDVYSDYSVKHFTMRGRNGQLLFQAEEPHYFSQCPANILTLPDEKSIFDCIIGLQDAANEVLTSEIDDYSAFCDALLTISGAGIDPEKMKTMREMNLMLLPEGVTANWLIKNANDTQVENILKRLQDRIYAIAQCPDFSAESFTGGVSSGVAIRYRLTGMETRAGKIEAEMKKALQRRIEIICGIASLKLGEEVFRDVQIEFKRNIPEDMTATAQLINSLKGTVSDATLLSQLDFVSDVDAELEAVKEQQAANMALYSFNSPLDNREDEDE